MMRFSTLVFAFLFAVMFYAGTANAQTRTWVSGTGDDVNPCSRTAPCKTFAGAISRTAAGGEINCLDPGGFGAVTITKSITIDCSGTFGSILSSGTTGIIVNDSTTAAPGTIRVILRGLTINGAPPTSPGTNGIRYISGASLTIENVFIENFTGAQPNGFGIHFRPNAGQGGRLVVHNTMIVNNGVGSSGGGIFIETGTGSQAQVMLNNVRISGNASSTGISLNTTGAGPGISATLVRSHVSNSTIGVSATSAAGGGTSSIVISDTAIVNNATGILTGGTNGAARVSNSVITGNTTGLSAGAGSLLRSLGGNLLDGNTSNGTFTDTIPKV
jgi:hypothetical protein